MAMVNSIGLMWVVVGHEDFDEMKGQKCAQCGKSYPEWAVKVRRQGAALQEDCCVGVILNPQLNRNS